MRKVGGDLLRVRLPDRHPIVRQDGEPRFRLADDALRVVNAEVRKIRPAVHQDGVDQHHIGLVLLGDALVVSGVGDPTEPVAETKTVRLTWCTWRPLVVNVSPLTEY